MIEIDTSVERLSILIDLVPKMFKIQSGQDFALQPWLGMWSKKQIFGYLVDSAAISHQRFVRIQYENEPAIFYNRNEWMYWQHYNTVNNNDLIQLWESYNKHLLHIIKNISPQNLEKKGIMDSGNKHSLKWFIKNYVDHIEHYLKEIFGDQFFLNNSLKVRFEDSV